MTDRKKAPYTIDHRQWIAETPDVRVQILTLGEGQEIPWHYHSTVSDSFTCLDGPMVIAMHGDEPRRELQAGETYAVPAGTPHRVAGKDDGPCRFLVVQGIGTYDFVPVDGGS
ncbi:MAG: cupin domain-containing protein [Rhodospirillales bacterium]|nr:cupin domain-containing protein [Rhodospirillales bacterium]